MVDINCIVTSAVYFYFSYLSGPLAAGNLTLFIHVECVEYTYKYTGPSVTYAPNG